MSNSVNHYFNSCRANWKEGYEGKSTNGREISDQDRIVDILSCLPLGIAGSFLWLSEQVSRPFVWLGEKLGLIKKVDEVATSIIDSDKKGPDQSDFIRLDRALPLPFFPANVAKGTLPSFEEICGYIRNCGNRESLSEKDFQLHHKNKEGLSQRDGFSQLILNSHRLMSLLDPKAIESLEVANENARSLKAGHVIHDLEDGTSLFVHVTNIESALKILQGGIKGSSSELKAVSLSLFDQDPAKPGLFDEIGNHRVGLIFEIPPIAIVMANRQDLYSRRNWENQENYIICQYQWKVIYKYISVIWKASKYYSIKSQKSKKEKLEEGKYHVSLQRIEKLIQYYKKELAKMSPEEQSIEFKKIFKREGSDILLELNFILATLKEFHKNLNDNVRKESLGRQQGSEKLLSQKGNGHFNEIFMLSPKSCVNLGLPEESVPKIRGVLFLEKDRESSNLKEMAIQQNLALYRISDNITKNPFYRGNRWGSDPDES